MKNSLLLRSAHHPAGLVRGEPGQVRRGRPLRRHATVHQGNKRQTVNYNIFNITPPPTIF